MALGPYCKALGIDEEVLSGQKVKVCESKSITNGVMWELKKYKTAKKLTTKDLMEWLIKIFEIKCENSEAIQEHLDKKFENLTSVRNVINKAPNKYRGEMERLMNFAFDFPEEMGLEPAPPFEPTVCASLGPKLLKVLKEKGGDEDDVDMSGHSDDDDELAKKRKAREEIIQLKKDLMSAKKVISSLNDKMSDLNKRCEIMSDLGKSRVSERLHIESDIQQLKTDWGNIMIAWHDCIERLNHVNNNRSNYLDVGYMVRRNKTKQGIFDELSFEFEKTLDEFKHKLSSLIEMEKKKKKVVSRENRQKSKTDRKRVRQESEENAEDNKKQCLSEEAATKEPIAKFMSIEDFMKSEKVDEFKGGKFTVYLRVIYTELISMPNVGSDVHEVIFSVLDELESLNTDKIPQVSFAANIFMEARMAVALQIFFDMLKHHKTSICNDGVTKFSWQDAFYDVTLADENNFKISIQDISEGSPDTSLDVLRDLFGEITNAKTDGNQDAENFVKTVKKYVSENDLLDKKPIEILFIYKQQMSPIVALNLDALPTVFRTKVILLNNFCTGLYFLSGLAKLADITVLAWESLSFGSGTEIVKDLKNNLILSKTVQQMHTFCDKIDEDSSDELGTKYREFVKGEKKFDYLPLAPIRGNIFNVIFHNSAGLWFFHEIGLFAEFFEKMKEKELDFSPLSSLLDEKHSFPFAKSLGLLGKLVCVPLWAVLEDETVEIGLRYTSLLEKFENWSKDASKFMKGQDRLFDDIPVSQDAVYVSLIKDNESTDALTKELLELFFTAFVPYVKFFLFGNATEKSGDSAMEIDTDNKISIHEDFKAFDRITINIHSLTDFAQDALTLFSKTRNGEWQDKLCSKDNMKVFEFIKKDYNKQLKNLYKRKIKLEEMKTQGQNSDKGNSHLINKKYKLIDDVMRWGGLWKNEKEVDAQIKDMKESDRLNAFRAQICFRRYILGEEHGNGLLDLASEGECFNAAKLHENLNTILKKECESAEANRLELATATDDDERRAEIMRMCSSAQELKPVAEPGKSPVPKEDFHWLLGKLITHTVLFDQGKECLRGICFAKKGAGGTCSYYINYKGKGVFVVPDIRIAEDIKGQNLQVIDPSVNDLIGSRLSRAFIKDDGDFEWHDCKVVGVTSRGSDFVVEFDFYGANAQLEDANIPELETFTFTTHLLEEYRTGYIRLF